MRVLVIGRNEILFASAQYLIERTDHQVVAIITARSMPEYKKREEDFRKLAEYCGAEFYVTQKIDDEVKRIVKDCGAEIGVSINWVSIIRQDLIDLIPYGILNAHFGDLPRYRGNAVTNWAILREEEKVVLTVHRMQPGGLDSGDIMVQCTMPLSTDATIDDINQFGEAKIPEMFIEAINGLQDKTIRPRPQAETGLTSFRCYPRLPCDGKINWALPARKIHALVRSLTKPYSGAYTYYRSANGKMMKLYIWRSRVVSDHTVDIGVPGHVIRNDVKLGESWIYTGDGIIALNLVSHGEHGEQFMPGLVWKSTRMRLGMDVEEELFKILSQP